MRTSRPIAVVVVYIWLSKCLSSIPSGVLKLIDTQDAMHLRLKQYRGSNVYSFFHCTLQDELRCLRRADKNLIIQAEEKRIFGEYLRDDQLLLAPHAHDIAPPPETKRKGARLLFVGAPHAANVEGLKWFAAKVWPSIYTTNRNVRLTIAGNVGRVLQQDDSFVYPSDGIEILGFVESIVAVCHNADVFVNPILRGSGLKLKVVEALCCGLPVVSTSKGIEGIPGIAECEAVRIADTPDSFSAAVDELLSAKRDHSEAALSFAEQNFSETVAYEELRAVLSETAESSPAATA